MTARAKLTVAGVLFAGGLWVGYKKAAFFLPGATPALLFGLERQAKRAARQERAA